MLLRWLRHHRRPPKRTEQDVPRGHHHANSRSTGGLHRPDSADAHGTTSTNSNDLFVGRVSGQDLGYSGETGAERRGQNRKHNPE